MKPNPVFDDLLSTDDLRRLESLYLTLDRTDLDLRAISLVLDALIAKYDGQTELLRDLRAATAVVKEALAQNSPCLTAIWQEFLRIQAERQAATSVPTTASPEQEKTIH